jgi:hypothetical protein
VTEAFSLLAKVVASRRRIALSPARQTTARRHGAAPLPDGRLGFGSPASPPSVPSLATE